MGFLIVVGSFLIVVDGFLIVVGLIVLGSVRICDLNGRFYCSLLRLAMQPAAPSLLH